MLEEVRSECMRANGPEPAEIGEWDVILSPGAVATLLGWMGYVSFSSRSLEDGMSFVAKQLDQRVTGDGESRASLGISVA